VEQFPICLSKGQEKGHKTSGESSCNLTSDHGIAPSGILTRVNQSQEWLLSLHSCVFSSLDSSQLPSHLGLPYTIFTAREQKRPPLPLTDGHQRDRKSLGYLLLVCSWDQECTFEVTLLPVPAEPCFASPSSRASTGSFSVESNQMNCSRHTTNVFKPPPAIQSLGQGQR